LIELLQHRGFSPKWRNWLCLLFSTASSLVRLNGVRGPWIKHRRPAVAVSLHHCNRLPAVCSKQGNRNGLLLPLRDRTARLRLPLYADDAGVFVNPTKADMDMVMQIMDHFGQATCLWVNTQKSTVAPKDAPRWIYLKCCRILPASRFIFQLRI
jgi:hypothetical protein